MLTILRYLTEFLRIVMRKITMTAMIASVADDAIVDFRNVVLTDKLKIIIARYTLNTSAISKVKNQTAYILVITFVTTQHTQRY